MRRRILTLIACALAIHAMPAGAEAHALLERTSPERGADVEVQPSEIRFDFSEPVETSFGSLRVFDSAGEEVQAGNVLRPGGEASVVATALRPGLPDGTYTATYRVVSADSHPVSGGFTFSIGAPDGGGAPISELLDEGGLGTDSAPFVAARWLAYLATGIVVGGLAFLLLAWGRAAGGLGPAAEAAFTERLRRVLGSAAIAGFAATLVMLPLQASAAAGVPVLESVDADLVSEVLETRFGIVTALRAAAFLTLAALLLAAPSGFFRRASRLTAAAAVPVAVLMLAPGLGGHASTQDPVAILLPADVVHLAAMSVWLGGIAALLLALPAATATMPPTERAGALSDCLRRFSPLALGSVIALALTGTVQAIVEVGSFPALVETGFGRTVLAKAGLLGVLAGLGWVNRSRLLPALGELASRGDLLGGIGRRLRANLRTEAGLIAVVLVLSALLVGYPPASESQEGPVSGSAAVGAGHLEYTVEPAAVGPNQIHLYLFDADDGSQIDPREVTASASLPESDLGPLPIELRKAGPGHYTAPNAEFGIRGDWELSVAVRTSRFDQDETDIEVPIR